MNEKAIVFYQRLIIALVVIGVVFGILAYFVTMYLALAELIIGTGLVYAIRGCMAADKNNVVIFVGASNTIKHTKNQTDIRQKVKKYVLR